MKQMPSRALIGAMLLCMLFCVVLAADWIPGLRGDFGWRWPYGVPDWLRLLPAVITVAVYVIGLRRIQETRRWLLWCMLGAAAIPVACLLLLGDPLYLLATRVLSGQATGQHMAGAMISDLAKTAREWPVNMPRYYYPGYAPMTSVHIALSPPGLPLLYGLANQVFAQVPPVADVLGMPLRYFQCQNFQITAYSNAQLTSAWIGILMPVWAALAVPMIYKLGGKLAASWWPLIPALVLFTPTWNTFYPLLSLGAFLLLRGALAGKISWRGVGLAALSGALVSLSVFFNISNVPLVAFLGLYAGIVLAQRWKEEPHRLSPPRYGVERGRQGQAREIIGLAGGIGVGFGIGLISVWGVYYLWTGVTIFDVLRQALGMHLGFEREYLPWVYLHLYDFALFAGLPIVLVALANLWKNVPFRRKVDWQFVQQIDPIGVALIVTLLVLVIGNFPRGETGRVWLFFMPFLMTMAARQLDGEITSRRALLVTATQAIMLLTMVGFLRVLSSEFKDPPLAPPEDFAQVKVDPMAAPASFDGQFTLLGMKGQPTADNKAIDLTLMWRSEKQVAVPYYLSALVVGPDSKPLPPELNWQPFDTRYPLTCWRPGQTVTETVRLPINGAPGAGGYWVSLSAFDYQAKVRVPITQSGNPAGFQIGLGPIAIQP